MFFFFYPGDLRIVIEYEDTVPAYDVANILLSLNKGFDRFVRRHRNADHPEAKLAIRQIDKGSIDIVLQAIDSANKLIDAGIYIAPFASHIVEIATSAINVIDKPKGLKADKQMVAAIAAPVANGNATQINVIVTGNPTFNIDSAVAVDIVNSLITKRPQIKASAEDKQASLEPVLTEYQQRDLIGGGLIGTALTVDGQWYVRLLDGGGVLVPTTGSVELQHGKIFRYSGRPVHGKRGEVVGIELSSAQPLD